MCNVLHSLRQTLQRIGIGAALQLILIGLISISTYAQVGFSDAFQKTVKRIAKERTKAVVLEWITKMDPTVGIVAHDLIGQIIESNDETKLIASNISVLTTGLFIYRIRTEVEHLLADSNATGVLNQAQAIGWTRRDVAAYSSLYFYYSERLKRGMFVSPYILAMKDEKAKVESLRYTERKSWVANVSGRLIAERSRSCDFTLDVRSVEILRLALLRQFQNDSSIDINATYLEAMLSDSTAKGQPLFPGWIDLWNKKKSIEDLRPFILGEFLAPLARLEKAAQKSEVAVDLSFDYEALRRLVQPFRVYADTITVWKSMPSYSKEEIVSNLRVILNDWLAGSSQNQWCFGYRLMLAGTYQSVVQKIDFTVFDHLRWGYTGDNWAVYGFAGGFIDPLIKQTINKTGSRTYPIGIGFAFHGFNLMPAIGVPYDNIKSGKYQACLAAGYEIPLIELTE